LLGASGAVEFGFSLLAIRDNIVPPTLNLHFPDTDCGLDYTPLNSRSRQLTSVMSLSFE
jgi:3-oxoacyl-(acyl-carrier-protein) synthase